MSSMSDRFIDTNVFVYMFDRTDGRKRSIATEIVTSAIREASAVISHQVVQETLNAVTRRTTPVATPEDAREFLDQVLSPLWTIWPGIETYRSCLTLQARYGFSFYDSLIVAAALDAGCSQLLSEDFQHGQRIEGLTVHNPFL